MKTEEAKKYEADPDFKIYLQLRKWDEAAKVEANKISVPTIQSYAKLLKKYCNDTTTPLEKRLAQIPQIELYAKNDHMTIAKLKKMAGIAKENNKDKKAEKRKAAKCL